MNEATSCPMDFRLVVHDSLPDTYEMSKVLRAAAAAVAAILDRPGLGRVDLRVR